MQLKILASTVLKQSTAQSSALTDDQKQSVAAGNTFELKDYKYVDGNHVRLTLLNQSFQGKETWYAFGPHVEVTDGAIAPDAPMLKVTANTILKQRPVQSSQLPDEEKQSVAAGTEFPLHSYAQAEGNHVKVALLNQSFKGKNTWYAYRPHIELNRELNQGTAVQPQTSHSATAMLKITAGTILKQRPVQSSELTDRDKQSVSAGTELPLQSYQAAPGNHIKVVLAGQSFKGHSTWYVYAPHGEVRDRSGTPVAAARPAPSRRAPSEPAKRVRPPRRLSRDELYDAFFKLVQKNQGKVTVMQFAMATRLSGEKAKDYLDKQAVEFNANFEVSETGDITYVFSL